MPQYKNITAEEINAFLTGMGFQRIFPPKTVEITYGKRVDRDGKQFTLRVFTGINPSGESRGVGEDAIRVGLFLRTDEGVVVCVGGSKRVNRTEGWRQNLADRINLWQDLIPKETCPKCGWPMVLRKSKIGQFLGCSRFPNCRETLKK